MGLVLDSGFSEGVLHKKMSQNQSPEVDEFNELDSDCEDDEETNTPVTCNNSIITSLAEENCIPSRPYKQMRIPDTTHVKSVFMTC